jgi:hypothetical protein
MSKEVRFTLKQRTFLRLKLETAALDLLQHIIEAIQTLFEITAINNDVVEVDEALGEL